MKKTCHHWKKAAMKIQAKWKKLIKTTTRNNNNIHPLCDTSISVTFKHSV